ncbi:hypothetical protein BGZ58_007465 [Dissophora ornata]|nr:hypothetical protein BGZ58_007465 [Dissophora ornata]
MYGNSPSSGHPNDRLSYDDHPEIVVVGPNTPESEETAIPLSTLTPVPSVSIDIPSDDGREQQGDETKINEPPVSPSQDEILEDGKGVYHKNNRIENPAPAQESVCETTAKTAVEMSTQRAPPGAKVPGVGEERVGFRGRLKNKLMSKIAKPPVDDGNGGDNNTRGEENRVDGDDEYGSGDDSESEYDDESEGESGDSNRPVVENNPSCAPHQPGMAPNIGTDEQDKDFSQKNKHDKGKVKGKGEDLDPAPVDKFKNDVKASPKRIAALKAKIKSRFRHRSNGSVAKPEANLGDDTKWLWDLRETVGGDVQSERKLPVVVPQDKDWKCSLPTGDIPSGFYSIVFCMTFSRIGGVKEPLDSLTVDANQFGSSDNPVYMNKTCKTTAEKEELSQIKLRKKTRVRLHRQIELAKDGQCHYIEFSINVKAYIVLFGQGKPQEYISVGRHHVNGDGDENYARGPVVDVHSYNISSSGTYATTLCFHKDNSAVIEIWSLKNDNNVHHHTTPEARGYIKTAGNRPDRADICLNVSSHGDYVALHSNKLLEEGIDCLVLRSTKGAADGSDSELRSLSEISLPLGLQEFYGYGTFHFLSTDNENEKERESERYITCDGKSLSIYETIEDWVRIQTIKLSNEQRLDSALNAILSMRGRCFAWTGNKNNVLIMHVDKEKKINLAIDGVNAETRTCLSRDGSQVAVLVRGTISIYETSSGKRVAEFGDGKYNDSHFEVVLKNGLVMIPEMGEMKGKRKVMRIENKVSDSEVCNDIHPDYELRYPAPLGQQLFTYSQGTVVNITRMDMDSKMRPESGSGRFKENMSTMRSTDITEQSPNFTSLARDTFRLSTTNPVIHGKPTTILTIEFCHPEPHTSAAPANAASATSESPICLTIPLGTSHIAYPSLLLEASSRLAIITGRYLQVWKLTSPTTCDDNIAELELVWALQKEEEEKYKLSDICHRQVKDAQVDLTNGAQFMMTLKPAKWRRGPYGPQIYKEPDGDRVVTFPFSNNDNMLVSLEGRVQQGIRGVVDMYINGDPKCQKAVIRYLESLVRPSDENPVSCIVVLCNIWRLDEKESFVKIMTELLPKTRSTWVPEINAKNNNKVQDPLAILLMKAETQPSIIGVAKVIMDYCVSHANSSMSLKFLAPVFISMNRLREMFPDEAQGCLNRMAFIHAISRRHIIDNHIIVHSPSQKRRFWRPAQKLWETKNPIMQLCVNPSKPDQRNEKFTLPVFVASFDALWSYNLDDDRCENNEMPLRSRTMMRTTTIGASMAKMSRWRVLLYMIGHKLQLKSKMYVKCHDFNLKIFDNPAIAALVLHKWNTIGFRYWLFRFVFQCCYYTMIVLAAILQVYFPYRHLLIGIFIVIIVMAAVFLWLELLQARSGLKRYWKSSYNLLDLVAYLTPMAAAIDQLVLFEMRIDGSVCKFVTIIQQAIFEIKVFFFIFGAGIIAFTIAMLHLLHACPLGGCDSTNSGTSGSTFPTHVLGALSATYFFMGGRYDPVSDNFNSQDWAFHIMMVIFFFFTVILMLNVLIALINVAFGKGGDDWRLVWVESRIRFIEAAENMSYRIPRYRESHSYFPNEIYFTATEKEVKEFKEKHEVCEREPKAVATKSNGNGSDQNANNGNINSDKNANNGNGSSDKNASDGNISSDKIASNGNGSSDKDSIINGLRAMKEQSDAQSKQFQELIDRLSKGGSQ